MTVGLAISIRNSRMKELAKAIDAGPGPGLLHLYTAPRPPTGGVATTKLVTLTFSEQSYNEPLSGSIVANPIAEADALASGFATWARITDSNGVFVGDFSVGTAGEDINLSSSYITKDMPVEVTESILTDGNV